MVKFDKEKIFFLLILLSFVWGYNWVVMKQGITYLPDLYFAFFRSVFGATILFGLMIFKKVSLKPTNLRYVLILGLLQTTGFIGFTVLALKFTKAGKTAILVYSMPFWLTLFSWLFLSEKPDRKEFLSNILAFTGLIIVLEPWTLDFIHIKSILGDIIAVISGIFWALSVIWQKKHKELNRNLLSVNAWQMFIGSIFILLMAFFSEPFHIKLSKNLIFAISYNAILANALAWIIFNYAVKKLPSGIMGLTMLLTPIIGMISSMIVLKETMNIYEILGSMLTVSGLLIITIDHIKKREN